MATSEELMSQLILEASNLTQAIKTYKTDLDLKVNTAVADMKTATDTRVAAALATMATSANIIEIYVDGVAGLDTNSGTITNPVKTITKALTFGILHKTLRVWLARGQTHIVTGRRSLNCDVSFGGYGGTISWSTSVEGGGPGGAAGVFANHPNYINNSAVIEFKSSKDLTQFTTLYPDPTTVTSAILEGYTAGFYTAPSVKNITVAFTTVVIKCIDWAAGGVPPEYFTRPSVSKGGLLGRRDTIGSVNVFITNCVLFLKQNPLITLASGIQQLSLETYGNLYVFEKNWKLDKISEGMYLIDNEGGHPVYVYISGASYYFADGSVVPENGTHFTHTRIVARPTWTTHIVANNVISKSVDAINILGNTNKNIDYIAAGNAVIDSLRVV